MEKSLIRSTMRQVKSLFDSIRCIESDVELQHAIGHRLELRLLTTLKAIVSEVDDCSLCHELDDVHIACA
jgi:hypothetical protein